MKRRNLLKGIGALGITSVLPVGKAKAVAVANKLSEEAVRAGVACVLIPQETAGPYPLDLSKDSTKFRQDITEGGQGTSLDLTFTVVNVNDNCKPIPNARVDIWHCDKDGVYSGYQQPGANTVGQTFMRGIQMTDSNGQVKFHTIYPGWYSGRITHIHFQVFLNSVLSATSQTAFPDSLNTTVYNTSLYSAHGQNTSVANNAADMVFSDGFQNQLLNITPNALGTGYNATLTIGIAAPVSGVINLEPETGGQFKLQQNFPNPFKNKTAITFSLTQGSNVEIAIFDMTGKEVLKLINQPMSAGEHKVEWDGTASGAPVAKGNYLFQLGTENSAGQFRQAKVLTVE